MSIRTCKLLLCCLSYFLLNFWLWFSIYEFYISIIDYTAFKKIFWLIVVLALFTTSVALPEVYTLVKERGNIDEREEY